MDLRRSFWLAGAALYLAARTPLHLRFHTTKPNHLDRLAPGLEVAHCGTTSVMRRANDQARPRRRFSLGHGRAVRVHPFDAPGAGVHPKARGTTA